MKRITKNFSLILLSALLITSLINCDATRNASNSQKGGVIGAAGGAVLGAIIGNNIGKGGNGELGAVIGGVVGGAAGIIIGNEMDKQAQKIEEEIPGAVVQRVDEGIVVTFDENSGVYFDTNKYNINSASSSLLSKLSNILKEYPDTNIIVVGHTDSAGSEEYNMTLSKNRALAVANFFSKTNGLDAKRINTNWFGETQPKFDNSTAKGRAKNRRVNIAIMPNDQMIKDAQKEAKTEPIKN